MDYAEFRQQYELQHPASVPRLGEAIQEYADWVEKAVGAMFVTSALASGVHTVPAVYQSIDAALVAPIVRAVAAAGSFIFVELSILLSAYLSIKSRWLAFFVGAFAFIGASAANLEGVQRARAEGSLLVSIILGVLAPLVCLVAGKLYVSIHRSRTSAAYRVRKAYDEQMQAWDAEINAAWDKHLRTEHKRTEPRVQRTAPDSPRRTADAPVRPDVADSAVFAFLDSTADTAWTARTLSEALTSAGLPVGKSKAALLYGQWKATHLSMPVSTNGHHHSN